MTAAFFLNSEEGSLPDEWRMERIAGAYRITRKPKQIRYGDFATIPFIPMSLIPDDGATTPSFKQKSPQEISSGTYFEKGDLLLSKITPSFENGKQAIASNIPTPFGIATTEVIPIQAIEGTSDVHFLFYHLLKSDVRKEIAAKMEGSTGRQRVPEHVVREWLIPLPPLLEQQRIAAVLRKIQKAVEIEDAIVRNARDLKRSLLRRLFTRGLRGEPLKETEIGPIPESWEVVPLAQVCTSSAFGPRFSGALYATDGGVLTLRTTDLDDDGRINFSRVPAADLNPKEWSDHLLQPDDCVVSRSGTCGIVAVFKGHKKPVLPGAFLIRVRLNGTILPEFFRDFGNSPNGRAQMEHLAQGAVQKNISGTRLLTFQLPRPSPNEQREIADVLQSVDDKIDIHESKKRSLQDLFKTMLHELITAQIRVNDLDIDTSEVKT